MSRCGDCELKDCELSDVGSYECIERLNDRILDLKAKLQEILTADRPQGWIPCSERLPEEEGRYLCTVNVELHQVRDMLYKPTSWGDEHRCKWKLQEDCYAYDWFVLAWMPLPEPWKGADDE